MATLDTATTADGGTGVPWNGTTATARWTGALR